MYLSANGQDGMELSLLCARLPYETGGVDLRKYTTIVIPYCTQDVHLGDNFIKYGDEYDGQQIAHKGASNMMGVLRWLFKNFPNPSQILLTGCSAGGTALPIAYNLITSHYNTRFSAFRSVQVNVIADSAVYLTPSYFLENSISNWNPFPLIKKTGFSYGKYRYDENFPTKLWDYIIKKGSRRDRWGFLTHTADPVSIAYFEAMNGYNYDDDDSDTWWTYLSSSLSSLENTHKNFKAFYREDEEGHCSFGLHYGFMQDDFGSWVGSIFKEDEVLGKRRPSVALFIFSTLFGLGVSVGLLKKADKVEVDSVDLLQNRPQLKETRLSMIPIWLESHVQNSPITIGYMCTLTLYFWSMIFASSFTNILDNPSIGPTAGVLSSFGINNPSLVVYDFHWWRPFSAIIVCSGLLTYLIVMFICWKHSRQLEERLSNSYVLCQVAFMVSTGSNLIYASTRDGASCGSVSFVLGLNAFSISMAKRGLAIDQEDGALLFPSPWISTFFICLISCVVFPFNNWVLICSSVLLGIIIARFIDVEEGINAYEKMKINRKFLSAFIILSSLLFMTLILRLRKPDRLYENPYFTGCNQMFTDKAAEIVSMFSGDNGQERLRKLNDSMDGQAICAQMCVPHIASSGAEWGIERYLGVTLMHGTCEDIGYSDFYVAKTLSYFSYSLDVELFYLFNDDN